MILLLLASNSYSENAQICAILFFGRARMKCFGLATKSGNTPFSWHIPGKLNNGIIGRNQKINEKQYCSGVTVPRKNSEFGKKK